MAANYRHLRFQNFGCYYRNEADLLPCGNFLHVASGTEAIHALLKAPMLLWLHMN